MTDPLITAARLRFDSMLAAMESAEHLIVRLLAREREALRAGCRMAAHAVHIRVNDAARLYLNSIAAARAGLAAIEPIIPEATEVLERRRTAFGAILRIELATLATIRIAANDAEADATAEENPDAVGFAV